MSPESILARPPRVRRVLPGLSFSGALSLCAVVAVLITVSVPRLRALALRENEADARSTAQLLVAALGRVAPADDALPRVGELLQPAGLAQVISDAELLDDGALLRRHGYLFELTRLPVSLSFACAPLALPNGAATGVGTVLAVRAWPWKHGATGCSAFLATAAGALLVHGNQRRRWDGPQAAGLGLDDSRGWSRVP